MGTLIDYAHDTVYKGYFSNDMPEGLQIVTNLSDQTEYRGTLRNLKKHGFGIYRCFKRGLTFRGDWRDDQQSGR